MQMATLSTNDNSAILQFLDDVAISINRLSAEVNTGATHIDDLLLEAEVLLQDVSFLSDLFPVEDGECLLKAVADVYLWLEDMKVVGIRMRGRPLIPIPEEQLELLLSFSFSPHSIANMLQVSAKTVYIRISE